MQFRSVTWAGVLVVSGIVVSGIAASGVAASGVVAQSDASVRSGWRVPDVSIDGALGDWPELEYVSDEVEVSAANDGEFLCLVIATSDSAVKAQMMRAGFAVYLDPKGKKGKTFGVRLPPLGNRLAPGLALADGSGGPLLSYFDVLGPKNDDARRMEIGPATGLEVAIGNVQGTFVIEVKVPFAMGQGHPYAPGIDLSKRVVGLGIVTPDPPRSAARGGGAGGGRSGGGAVGGRTGGRSGGRGGGAAGGQDGRGGVQGKALKIWTTVALAAVR